MSINIMRGAFAAAIMESRGAKKEQVLSGAILSAFMPGVLGLAIPLLLTRNAHKTGCGASPAGPASPAPPPSPDTPATPAGPAAADGHAGPAPGPEPKPTPPSPPADHGC